MRSSKKYIYKFSCYGEMRDRIEEREKEEQKEKQKNTSRAAARCIK